MDNRLAILAAVRVLTFFLAIIAVASMIFLQFFVVNDASAAMLPHSMGDNSLREVVIDDLALDGSLGEQYVNFMKKVLTGEFFISVSVRKYVSTSEFVYGSAWITASEVLSVLIVSLIFAGLYAHLAHKWSANLKGKLMLLLALIGAVCFVVPLLIYIEMWLFDLDLDELARQPYLMTIAVASIPVSASLVLILEGLQRRTGPVNPARPYESYIKLASGQSFGAIVSIFLVFAVTCVLMVDALAFTSEGLGSLVFDATLSMDYQVLMACIYIVAVMLLILFLMSDLLVIHATKSSSLRSYASDADHVGSVPKDVSRQDGITASGFPDLLRELRGDGVFIIAGVVIIVLLSVGVLAPFLSTVQEPDAYVNLEPNWVMDGWINPHPPSLTPSPYTGFTHPLGTDPVGRDVYSLLLYDSLSSTLSALLIAAISIGVGVVASFFRDITQSVGRSPKEVAGWIGWLLSDVFLAVPLFLALSAILITRTSEVFALLAIVLFIFASFGKGLSSGLLLPSPQPRSRGSVLGASSVCEVFHIGKYCFLFCFFSIAIGIFFFWNSLGWMDIGWVHTIEAAYNFGAFYRGTWWVVVPQMIMLGLLAASVFLAMDRLERRLHSRYVNSETVTEAPSAPGHSGQ